MHNLNEAYNNNFARKRYNNKREGEEGWGWVGRPFAKSYTTLVVILIYFGYFVKFVDGEEKYDLREVGMRRTICIQFDCLIATTRCVWYDWQVIKTITIVNKKIAIIISGTTNGIGGGDATYDL